jgi:predicted AAA+ superfamily ATPase
MESLTKKFKDLLSLTMFDFKRYMYSEIAWNDRMIGIVGARGVGKTTMVLQYIKENLDVNETLYGFKKSLRCYSPEGRNFHNRRSTTCGKKRYFLLPERQDLYKAVETQNFASLHCKLFLNTSI